MKNLTEVLMGATCPYNNPYQGNDKRVLFVCSAGLLRSATGARMYGNKYNTRAAGTHPYALVPLSDNLLAWAHEVVFVNKENYDQACKSWDLGQFDKQVRVLDIPDQYEHMHPELQKHFVEQYESVE